MIVATIKAEIRSIDEKKGTYRLRIRISSEVPAQALANPLAKALPAGVNLRTETFLRGIERGNRPVLGKTTLGISFWSQAPIKGPVVEVVHQMWALPEDLKSPKNIVWAVLPGTQTRARPSVAEILADFKMWGGSGEGSGSIELLGVNTDAQGKPAPNLPMRPFYVRWRFNLQTGTGFIRIMQRGRPVIGD
jgi:hypothetical protein